MTLENPVDDLIATGADYIPVECFRNHIMIFVRWSHEWPYTLTMLKIICPLPLPLGGNSVTGIRSFIQTSLMACIWPLLHHNTPSFLGPDFPSKWNFLRHKYVVNVCIPFYYGLEAQFYVTAYCTVLYIEGRFQASVTYILTYCSRYCMSIALNILTVWSFVSYVTTDWTSGNDRQASMRLKHFVQLIISLQDNPPQRLPPTGVCIEVYILYICYHYVYSTYIILVYMKM